MRREEGYVRDVDTSTGEVGAELRLLHPEAVYLVGGDFLLEVSDSLERWSIISWDYDLRD